ncbi:MAG: MFS transporter, partial [Candidatus Binatota bacterium]
MSQIPQTERREEWRQLAVICLGAFLFFNSFGSVNVAVPTIQAYFGASLAAVQWISIMGTVTISSLSFCFGRAGDILGQKRLYRTGVSLYALGSGLVAVSQSFPGASPLTVGIIMASLPLCTAFSSPLSGRLADRLDGSLGDGVRDGRRL